MNRLKQVRTTIRKESGKELQAFTLLTTLLVALIVFSLGLVLDGYSKIRMLDQYLCEVPVIVQEREDEFTARSHVFEEDVMSRGELGARIYRDYSGLSSKEKLEKICSVVCAESVSLMDERGTLLSTTGTRMPEEQFKTRIETLKMRTPVLELYSPSKEKGEDSEAQDGTAFIMFPISTDDGRRLVFEFSCRPLMNVYNELGNWPSVLDRMLSGLDVYAYVRTGGGNLYSNTLEDVSQEEQDALKAAAADVFKKSARFFRLGKETSYGLISFRNEPALAVVSPYPDLDAQLLLALPLYDFISTGFYCALTLSAFIVFSMILFSLYVLKVCARKYGHDDLKTILAKLDRRTRSGRNLLLTAIGCFSIMLLMLEYNATLAYIGTTKRTSLEYDVAWHENQRGIIRSSYTDIYRTRTQVLAELLTDNKDYQTHHALQALSNTLHAEYLMLFDRDGHEITASNSYTGFSVSGPSANLSEEYQAVLLGYPYAVVGPSEDPYTKKQQIGTAVLMTTKSGEPDGFLLAVYDAGAMNKALKSESLEHTVSTFAVAAGNEVAVVNDETGIFIAHTDQKKIGHDAEDYITKDAYGKDYAGFTTYDGREMYASGVSSDGKSLLYMIPNQPERAVTIISLLMIAAVLLIIGFLYCPRARVLCARALDEAIENKELTAEDFTADEKHPLSIFTSGYSGFLTLMAGITLIAAYTMVWPAFTFVYGGLWSRGIHLFSLWAALFFLALTVFAAILLRMGLQETQKRTDSRTRTILKLADSFVAYTAGAVIIMGILYMFGVNTTAILASAGIVSIAVGMGAKDMAADILAGLFIAIEDSIHMGDIVSIKSWEGRVTDMGIRTIELTDDSQNIKILNNSQISDVVNMSRKKTICHLDFPLERRTTMAEIETILKQAAEKASEEMPELYGSLRLEGIHDITQEGCTARLTYACAEAGREATTKRLQAFLEEEIQQDMEQAAHSNGS